MNDKKRMYARKKRHSVYLEIRRHELRIVQCGLNPKILKLKISDYVKFENRVHANPSEQTSKRANRRLLNNASAARSRARRNLYLDTLQIVVRKLNQLRPPENPALNLVVAPLSSNGSYEDVVLLSNSQNNFISLVGTDLCISDV